MSFTPRDVKDVSSLVAKKLELYMNHERREDRFDPQGRYRTTPNMQTLDLMYHMLDTADMKKKEAKSARSGSPHKDKRSKKSKKLKSGHNKDESSSDTRNGCEDDQSGPIKQKKEGKEKKSRISPCLVQNSRRVVAVREAERLTQNANKIFEQQDLDKLHVIHRYRPHSPDIAAITENGKVANYTLHVGSALHSKNYVDYYMKEGLQSSKKEHAKRLQRLQAKKAEEPLQGQKCSDEGQSRTSTSLLRMQEILSPCQSLDSLSSSRPPTPRKLNPLTIEKPNYTTLTNVSHSSRGSSEKHSKAASHLYKAKRYASGFGYRIIADNINNVEIPKENNEAPESRADFASSEEYCKFSSSQAENHESGREGFGSDIGDKKALEITDVEMEYKKLQSSIESAPLSKDLESEDTRAQTNNESYISGSHISARSTASQFSNQPKEMDRSYCSNHSVASGQSGTYQTRESDLYDTTQSEQDLDTGRSGSLLSSTPRRYRAKNYKQEPIQTIIHPPEVPRLGIPSDVNETTGRVSSLNSSAVEEYLTAEEKALQHPDARALDGRINTSQDRAKERKLDNDDTRAERSQQNILGSDEAITNSALESSLPPIDPNISPKAHNCEQEDGIRKKKMSQENKVESERSYKQEKSFAEQDNEAKETEDIQNSSVAYQESDVVIDCKEGGSHSQTKNVHIRKRANEVEGIEVERGEDLMKNMELHRGEVPVIEKTKAKVKPERGDDTPRTMAAKGRLTKSAKRRGVSNYYTMGEDERGLEKEYFEPLDENEKEQYIPSTEQEKGSELNTPASSRPSSACSASSDGTMQSASRKKTLKPKAPLVNDICQEQDKAGGSRPQSPANKSVDGRGDDTNSVKNQSNQATKSKEKEVDGPDIQEELQREKMSTSIPSQASYGEDAQNYKMHVSSGSRGSITTKERLGTGKGYSIEGEMMARGHDENSDRKSHDLASAKGDTERKSLQSQLEVEENFLQDKAPSNDQPVVQEVRKEALLEKGASEPPREENQTMGGNGSTEALKLAEQIEVITKNEEVQGETQENSDVNNGGSQILNKNTSSENSERDKKQAVTSKDYGITPEKEIENKEPTESAHQELPVEEKAFIEGDSAENEIIKEPVSASVSLLISDGETVIDFRPLSASTAISFSNDHDSDAKGDHKRMSLPKPSKIVEVTEIESNIGSGRIAKEANVPHPAERRESKSKENKMHVVNIADVKLESYENIKEHPAIKRRSSDYLSNRNAEKTDFHSTCNRNISLPVDQEHTVAIAIAPFLPVKDSEGVEHVDTISTSQLILKTDTQKENTLQDITNDEAKPETRETINEVVDKDPQEKKLKPEGNAKSFNSGTGEKRIQTETVVSNDEKLEEKCPPEKQRLHVQSELEQDQVISSELLRLQEKAVHDQDSKCEKRLDPIPSQEMKIPDQALTDQEKTIDQTPPEKRNLWEHSLSQHEKAIDQIPSKIENVSGQYSSKQERLTDQVPPQEVKVSQQVPSDQVELSDQSEPEKVKISQQALSDKEKIIDQLPSQDIKVFQHLPFDQGKVSNQIPSEADEVTHQVLSDQAKIFDQSPPQKVKVSHQVPSDSETVIDQVPPQEVKVSHQVPSVSEKIIDQAPPQEVKVSHQVPSVPEKIIDQAPQHEVKVSHQVPSDPEKRTDQVPPQEVKISHQVPSDSEKRTDQVPPQEVKVSHHISSDPEKRTDQVPLQEVKVSHQVITSDPEKRTDQVPPQEVKVSHQVTSDPEKRTDQVPPQEVKVSHQVTSDPEKRTDQVPLQEVKVSHQVTSDPEKRTDQVPLQEVKMSHQVTSDPEKRTDQVPPQEVKVSHQVTSDPEKRTDQVPLQEVKVSHQVTSDPEKRTDQVPPQIVKVSHHIPSDPEKRTDQVPLQEVKVSHQVTSDPEKRTDQVPPQEIKISHQVPSDSEKRTDQVPPQEVKMSHQVSSDPEKIIDQVPPQEVKVSHQVPSDSEKRTDQVPPQELLVSHQVLSDPETIIDQVPPQIVKVSHQIPSDPEKRTDQVPPQEVKMSYQVSSDPEKMIDQVPPQEVKVSHQILSEKEKLTDQDQSQEIKECQQVSSDQQKINDQIPSHRVIVPQQVSLVQDKIVDQVPSQEVNLSHQVLSDLEKITDPIPSQEVKLSQQVPFDREKRTAQGSSQEEKLSEEVPSYQEKGIDQVPVEEAKVPQRVPLHEGEINDQIPVHNDKVSQNGPSFQKKMIDQVPAEEAKVSEGLPSDQENIIDELLSEVNVFEPVASAQEKTVDVIPSEVIVSEPVASDQEKIIDAVPSELNFIEPVASDREKIIDEVPSQVKVIEPVASDQEKIIDEVPSELNVIEPVASDQEKIIDQSRSEEVTVSKHIPSVQKQITDHSQLIEEKVSEQVLSNNSKVTDKASSEEVKLSENLFSDNEKRSDPSPLDERKVLEQGTSDQDKINQTPSVEMKVLEEAALENEPKIDQIPLAEANVLDYAEVDQERKIDEVPSEDVKVLGSSLPDQGMRMCQTPLEVKAPDQTSSGQENMINPTPYYGEETTLKEHSTDNDKVLVVDRVKVMEQLTSEHEKVIGQASLEQEKEITKPLPKKENVTDLPSLEQEKGMQSPPEQFNVIEQLPHEQKKSIELESPP